jgi:hypothetical protein
MTEKGDDKAAAEPTPAAGATGSRILAGAEALAISGASAAFLGVPLPPTVAKSVASAITVLVGALVALPVGWLEDARREQRAKSDARVAFWKKAGQAAAKRLDVNEDLADRAIDNLLGRAFRQQATREEIAADAILELKAAPPEKDPEREVDADWLELFAKHAETKTSEDMKAYFSRVLASEIRKPGSFSPETIEVLAKLSPNVAQLFQSLCNMTAVIGAEMPAVLAARYHHELDGKILEPYGLTYDALLRLADAGLVRSDLNIFFNVRPRSLQRVVVADRVMLFRPITVVDASDEAMRAAAQDLDVVRQLPVITLTAAGIELRQIVHMTPNEAYVAKFVQFLARLGLEPDPRPVVLVAP